MNWEFINQCRFLLFILLFHRTVSYGHFEDHETFGPSHKVVDQTSKDKVEVLGSALKKHIHLLRKTSETKVDLIFLVDSSASVGKSNFGNELKFVRKLLADFVVDNNHTKIAVITFSSRRFVLRQIDYITPQPQEKHKCTLIDDDLPNIRYKGGGTYTLGAFREAKEVLKSARHDASKAIFLITDGFSNGGDPRPDARKIRESGVKIFTVGIANGNRDELWDMSSEPKNETSFILDSFEEFESLARRALHEDLGRGDFIVQPEDKCSGLCFKGFDCCDKKATCKCGTYTGTYECICGPGYYGTGLRESCKPCPPGTYKARPSPGDVSTCTRCPDENHTTGKGAVDFSQCACKKGFRDFNNTGCVAMRCPALSAPRNGYFVNDKCDNVFNAACGIRCKPGYYLKGSSLRICQEGGSWSGRQTECIMKTCPALPRPKNGNMICDKDGFSFSTVCRFTCDTGYKLVGSRKRECLAIAAWTGINTRCREITCRPLPFIKDGKVYPSACTKDNVQFGTTCQITCYHGYSVVGPPIKQCTPDGMWVPSARGEMTHCEDTSPPIMKCPPDVEIDADPDDSSAEVIWQPPVALDNSGIRPIVTVVPAIEPPKRFPIGFTKVKYIAEDLSGNKIKCKFTVHVKDVTPPMADRCVSPFPYITSEQYANVTWDEPEFSDNSGTVTRVERNIAPGLFPQGETEVIYTAFDNNGNNNTCVIKVNVLPHPCQYPPVPVNGERECFETDEGVHCSVNCLEGYAFAIQPADGYFCAYDQKWRPEGKLPIPDCSVETSSNSVAQPASVTYIGSIPCGKEILVNEMESIFQQKVKEQIAAICDENVVCEVENIQTSCEEEDEDFNKIKLVFNHRNRRNVNEFTRLKRATNPQKKSKKKSYSITFTFTVKGKMKKPNKDKSPTKKLDKLESSMEQVADTVQIEAQQGTWDLKMKNAKMQFSNISYDSEQQKLECEEGSILINTSCIRCPVGTFFNVLQQKCESCLRGSYQPEEGQYTCHLCPNLTSTQSSNSRSKEDCKAQCLPGTFSKDGIEQCTTCPKSSYQNLYGQTTCNNCPRRITTLRRGTRRLSMCKAECSPGYASKTGLEPCLPCPKGTYQYDTGKTFCLNCPGEGKTLDTASTDVSECQGSNTDYQSDIPVEVDFDECFAKPCKNGATCRSRGGFGIMCICGPGYTGAYCEKELDECESDPCFNGGSCVDLKVDYSCKCVAGFTGKKCEVNIDECLGQPCVNNGTCVDGINNYNCSCLPEYEGPRCERIKDDCKDAQCQHEGVCVNTLQGYNCQCANGYSGVNCEIDNDDCSSGPCRNDGTCVDEVAGFSCVCMPGYTGKQCLNEIDECASLPCFQGATCVDRINSFECICPQTFSGRLCETELDSKYLLDFPSSGTINYSTFKMGREMSAFSIGFWIRTSDEINQGTPFSYSVGAFDNALTITNYDGFVIYVNNKKINTDVKVNDGTWHHVLVTWSTEKGAWKIYKNAFLWDEGYNLAAGETIKGGGKVMIGQEQDKGGTLSPTESFVGLLTNLNVWSKQLTQSEIETMIVTCDKNLGDIIAWSDVQSGLHGDLQPNPSGFCQDCPIPSKPLYSTVKYAGTKNNDTVSYTCPRGYDLDGPSSRRCLVTSQWEKVEPVCLRVDCGFPGVIRNGYLKGSTYSFDNRVRYECKSGYRLFGNTTRYCTEKGEWEGLAPTCEEIRCVLPILSENTRVVSTDKQSYQQGDIVSFTCTTGYRLFTDHDSVTCQEDGTWDETMPTCDTQTCKSPPSVVNSWINEDRDSYSVGFEVTYTCDYGYKLSTETLNQKGKLHCLPSGEWENNLPRCTIITCQKPPTVPNALRTYDSLNYLSIAEYVCESGYTINGRNVLECIESGFWDPAPPDCDPVECGPTDSPPNAIANAATTTYGSIVNYQCEPGFNLNGGRTRECLANGTWSDSPPRCFPVSCGQPDRIEHGSVVTNSFTFKNTATYTCDTGYNLIGDPERICMATGLWSSALPTCSKLECDIPPNIDHGDYTESSFYYEDVVTYKCEHGYNIDGKSTIQCQGDGKWSSLETTCQIVHCPNLTALTGGQISTTGQTFRSVATYSCNDGYTMDGENIRVCQPEGFWSGKVPTCNPVVCPNLSSPEDGKVSVTSQTYPSIAKYECNVGYIMEGESDRVCQPDGSWSSKAPNCVPVSCPTLTEPENGRIINTGNIFGSNATYLCNDGYTIKGKSMMRMCQSDGIWSGSSQTCILVNCPNLVEPDGGSISITSLMVKGVATYACNNGYLIKGETISVCQQNGVWSNKAPICDPVSCPVLEAPDNGNVNTFGQTFRNIATYSCSDGYSMVGGSIRVCQSDGTWSGTSPNCRLVTCPSLTIIEWGSISITSLTVNGVATYLCEEGYLIEGNNIRVCQQDGVWSSSASTCVPISCPLLTAPNNGQLSTTGQTYRNNATYYCNDGYTIDGERLRICQSNGTWSGSSPICSLATCPSLETPEGGSVSTTNLTVSSIATYSCLEGYLIEGENIRVCQPEGFWSSKAPSCVSVSCQVLESPDNGNVNTLGLTFRNIATYSCSDGYSLEGGSIRVCQSDGTWSGTSPNCRLVTCPSLTIEGGSTSITRLTVNGAATYVCEEGYLIEGDNIRLCQPNGEWSGNEPNCVIISCPILMAPNNGQLSTTGQTYRNNATYSCSHEYTIEGESLRICQSNGTWSGVSPNCSLTTCPSLKIPAGGNVSTTNLTVSGIATYSCDEGYLMEGENIRVCQPQGFWSSRAPTCVPVSCPDLEALDNGVISTTGQSFLRTATYSCNIGYKIDGNSERECQSDGTWSGTSPTCSLITCLNLTSLDNGNVSTNNMTVNGITQYSCNEGYFMEGENTRLCQTNGSWTGTAPECSPVTCSPLLQPNGGNIEANNLTFRGVATYSCKIGFIMEGDNIRICQSNGLWSGLAPNCTPINCPIPTNPNQGSFNTTGFTVGSVVTFFCNYGFNIEGESIGVCQPDGAWSAKPPTCYSIVCAVLYDTENGKVETNGQTFGSIATYSCYPGYAFEGNNTRICQSDGLWSGKIPECVAKTCAPPPPLDKGEVSYKDLDIQSVALYLCNDGYRLVGDYDVRRCMNNLTWSGSQPSCEEIRCQEPLTITNGFLSTTGMTYNSVASFECNMGFQLNGNRELTCTKSGEWSGQYPSCDIKECETPTRVISNGRMIGERFTYGETISYTCDIGYNLSGSVNRTCLHTGDWNEPIPICEIVRCSRPRIAHGLTSTFKNEYDTRITYSCRKGHVLFGPLERLCLANGSWTGPNPVCVKCNEPPKLQNGVVNINNEIATYECDVGYNLFGNKRLECQMDGSWINDLPICVAIECDDLSTEDFANGIISQTGYFYNDTAIFTCSEGHDRIGPYQRQCLDDGSWSGTWPICTTVTCPAKSFIENGRVEGNNAYNSSLFFTCNEGYKVVGQPSLVCLSSGLWSGITPNCTKVECNPPPNVITNGRVLGNEYTYKKNITYRCDTGYELQGSAIIICLESGQWDEPLPSCELIHCDSLQLLHASISSNNNEYGSNVTISCDEGYVMFGESERLCLANGSWTGSDPVCIMCKKAPNLSHGTVGINDKIATYECNTGYNMIGNNILECQQDGSWINSLPICVTVECDDLTDEVFTNGSMAQTGYFYGDTVDFVCNEGYDLIGSNRRRCLLDGSWSGTWPICLIVRCPGNFEIVNGKIKGDNVYKSNLTFTCNEGYQIVGDPILTCQSTGAWSGTVPYCEIIECERLPQISHGSVSVNSFTVGGRAVYSCEQTYELTGDPTRICLNTAFWSGEEPHCVQLRCPPPTPIQHGSIVGNSYVIGQNIKYYCAEGFILQGIPFRLCLHQLMWSGTDPICIPVRCERPSPVSHGTIINSTNENVFGDKIQYQCDEGYITADEVERQCTAHGQWSGIAPSCSIVKCGPPKEINKATIFVLNDSSFSFRSTVLLECIEGYTSVSGKSITSICTSEGVWSVSFLECYKMQCPPLGSLTNGHMAATGLSFNDVVTFSCNEGFTLNGTSEMTCLSSSTWSSSVMPTCDNIICPPPERLAYGFIQGNNYTYGNTISYVCNIGYTLTGDNIRTCVQGGGWSGRQPFCNQITCNLPQQIPNGQWNSSDASFSYNYAISFSCTSGYIANSGSTLRCSETGRWEGDPVSCVIVTCPEPTYILNGNVNYKDVTYNNEADYECNPGYELQGDDKLICLESGNWDKSAPSCTSVNCGVPDFVPFAVINGNVYTFGNIITYICQNGYTIAGDSTRTCSSNGEWSGYPPVCNAISCEVPPDVNNAIRLGTDFTYQSTIIYHCSTGYSIAGTETLICGLNGKWLGDLPSCEIISCGPPPVIPFSTTTVTGLTYGSTVNYVCNGGYIINGDPIAMCEENGRWTSTGNPVCRPVDCGRPVEVLNGNVQFTSTTYQSNATYTCDNMFSLVGQSTIHCNRRGLWDGVIPICKYTTCGEPILSGNVNIVGGGNYAIGETVRYVCPEGHILIGSVKSDCLESGYWSGTLPQCVYVACGPLQIHDHALKIQGIQNRTYHLADTLQFECERGYRLQGQSSIMCQTNGTWSANAPTCTPIPTAISQTILEVCPSVKVITHSKEVVIPVRSGSSVDIQCSTGYQSVGNMSAACSYDQSWVKPTGYCRRAFCGKPRITDMVNVVRVQGSSYFYGDQIRFRCRPGILPVKIPPVLTCTESGSWDGNIACSLPCKGGCFNGGMCLGLYGCKCPAGFGGKYCERAYCILPCLNGGTCISPYLCSCLPGYRGSRCQSPICDRPCQYGGTCIKPNMCHCKHGFKKPFCDHPNTRSLPSLPPPIRLHTIPPISELSRTIDENLGTTHHRVEVATITTTESLTTPTSRPTRSRETTSRPTRSHETTPRPTESRETTSRPTRSRETTSRPTRSRETTLRPAYLDYIDYEFRVPDPN
ncbi:sushi, von Willebrand factor type A, EGF and pentraxin domain-containing protein 1-like [Mytilus trossulus]|uniref:sushi, von Willebrand factor type A, EGF and pentraxin domain-containing protein 1-like n=1 Tax=Mytilus trossulus TaxID=6551 RepID=UPI0030068971